MPTNMKKRDWLIVAILVCVSIVLFIYFDREQILALVRAKNTPVLPTPVVYEQTQTIPKTKNAQEINLAVPFTSQAPTGNWEEPFQDSCEEASVLMVHEYYAGNTFAVIDPKNAETSLQKIVDLENKLFGYFIDTTVSETATFAEKMYGYGKSEIVENPTVDQIKTYLNKGEPVLVPAYGRALKNPYFVAPGPVYHMLVIRGYTKDNKFITNDPGTKHGQGYVYSFDTIMNAMHDWNEKDILTGKKAILVLHPANP